VKRKGRGGCAGFRVAVMHVGNAEVLACRMAFGLDFVLLDLAMYSWACNSLEADSKDCKKTWN